MTTPNTGIPSDFTSDLAKKNRLLIIASSARMLAQLAKNIAFSPVVIDCFSDTDTQNLTLDGIRIDNLSLTLVKAAISSLESKHTISHVIYGSGLERYPETLHFLKQKFSLLGNTPDTFLSIQNKPQFFQNLDQFKIPHPKTLFSPPSNTDHWLIKPLQGEGGIGIQNYTAASFLPNHIYWQKQQPGLPMSVLFIANGTQFKVVGFNKQFTHTLPPHKFVFSAIISTQTISDQLKNTLNNWLTKLVPYYHLKGINSLDFIAQAENIYALEINPRPPASMQLYAKDILATHIHSINSNQPLACLRQNDSQGYQIIFANKEIRLGKDILWPSWAVDIPKSGAFIHTGQPICSIIARDKNEQQVKNLLLLRQQIIKKLLQ